MVRHAHRRLAYFGSLVSLLFLLLPGLAFAQVPERTHSKEADFKKIGTQVWDINPTRAESHRDDKIWAERFWLKSEAARRFHDRLRPERPVSGVSAAKPVAQVSVSICDRTAAVIDAILSRISGARNCSEVTSTQLTDISGTLYLRGKNISSLKGGDFDGLISLTGLDLGFNDLVTLPNGIFDQLTSLTSLDLSWNNLVTFPDGIFDQLTSLTWLDLDVNNLVTLPDGIFDQLTSLTVLDLDFNNLVTLPDGIFDQLTSLIRLGLSGNDLVTLPDGIFDHLTSLTSLFLWGNDLVTLPDSIFDQLTSLTSLVLSSNDLGTLPDGIFDQLTSLDWLSLSYNDLGALPDGIFDQLTSLTRLDLEDNDLGTLPDGVFKNLTQLALTDEIRLFYWGLSLQDNPGAPFRPVVNAGADLMVQPGAKVSIPGSVTGPWGGFVRWEWIQVDGPDSDTPMSGVLSLTGSDTATPSFAAPMAEGDLHFRLVAAPAHTGVPNDSLGHATSYPDWVTVRVATATNSTEPPSVVDFALLGNYPNPFNPSTTILLDLPQVAVVSVEVFNVLGQRVHREDFPVVAAGPSKPLPLYVSHLSSGTYVYQVTARMGDKVHHAGGRMTLVK
ncbi:MAG: leucine-rich repeat protein [Bacteroidetes bacterium]|nr:leucine-rich repeat protein [Bacteroidota bacterium]MDE2670983.1 leucine-rich repeat protein [Bacteroidota bacterium]